MATLWIVVAAGVVVSVISSRLPVGDGYDYRYMKRTEIEELMPFFQKVLGTTPSARSIKSVLKGNSRCIVLQTRRSQIFAEDKPKVVGFCSIIPVTNSTAVLFEQERLTGAQFDSSHISKSVGKTIYIGSIGAVGLAAKAKLLNYLMGRLDNLAQQGVRKAYTRPITTDGLRIAKKYGFSPVDRTVAPTELGRIYCAPLPRQEK